MQLYSLIEKYNSELKEHYDEGEVKAIIRNVFTLLLKISPVDFALRNKIKLSNEAAGKALQVLIRLKQYEPLQYIIGETEFRKLRFKVDRNVLIPRPETEELVEWAAENLKSKKKLKILDIGTGSGCIAVSLKKEFPDAEVFATDISKPALQIAKFNAKANHAAIKLVQHDVFRNVPSSLRLPFNVVISNPPYVTYHEKRHLLKNVTDYEPHVALFVEGRNPLLFYDRISMLAASGVLKKGGKLFFEINEVYGEEIKSLMKERGFFNIRVKKDLSGKNRMISCVRK